MKSATATEMQKQQPHRFDPEILREYDIRGQIGKNLSAADAYALGCAFGTYTRRQCCAIPMTRNRPRNHKRPAGVRPLFRIDKLPQLEMTAVLCQKFRCGLTLWCY